MLMCADSSTRGSTGFSESRIERVGLNKKGCLTEKCDWPEKERVVFCWANEEWAGSNWLYYRKGCLHIGLKRNGLAAICDLSKGCWLFAYMKIGFKELVA